MRIIFDQATPVPIRPYSLGPHHPHSSAARGAGFARVLFSVGERRMLLHGFVKKTQKTPQRDIDLALKRKRGGGA
jgi:phage-related protein